VDQAVSVAGAIMILVAYTANQLGLMDRVHPAYSWLNLVGALILTIVAYRAQQWGFVLLEGVWTIVSVPPIFRRRRPREA
jgi:hypothetical protein